MGLSSVLLLSIHDCEPHSARDKNIIILVASDAIRRFYLLLVQIIMMGLVILIDRLQRLQLVLLRIFVAIVGHVSTATGRSLASPISNGSFLIVAV